MPTRRPPRSSPLAHARALREDWVNPTDLRPVYLRHPDAQIDWATRKGRVT